MKTYYMVTNQLQRKINLRKSVLKTFITIFIKDESIPFLSKEIKTNLCWQLYSQSSANKTKSYYGWVAI